MRGAGAVYLMMCLLACGARAHGGLSIDKDQCVLRIGPDLMHFTGYQPLQTTQMFCEDIPVVGATVIVLDAVDSELREMTTEVRIIKDVASRGVSGKYRVLSDDELSSDYLDPLTVSYLPPRRYPTGTLHFEHIFKEAGSYIGIVTAKNDHGQIYVSQFPFSVGRSWIKMVGYYSLLVASIIGGLFLYWKFGLAQGRTPEKKASSKRLP